MAALNLREDETTGELNLEPRMWPRLLGALGNLGWFVVLGLFFLVQWFSEGRFDPVTLIVVGIVLLLSLASSLSGFFATTVKIEPATRTLSRTTRLVFLPIRSTVLSFSDLANIQVQLYRQSGRSSHNAYRVNAIDKAGRRIPLNWDGQRDEMLALAQKISGKTGAHLLDQTETAASTVDQVIEMARNLGLPLPEETASQEAAPESRWGSRPAVPRGLREDLRSEATPRQPMMPDSGYAPRTEEETFSPASETSLAEAMKAEGAEPSRIDQSLQAPVADSSAAEIVSSTETDKRPRYRDLRGLSDSTLDKMIAEDRTDSDARYALARNYHARGQLDPAIELYQKALRLNPSTAEAQNDLGVALQQRGKRKEAEMAFRRAAALAPFSFISHLNLAMLLRAMNRAVEASQEFYLARQSAQGDEERRIAEAASSGTRMEPRLSS